MKIKIFHPPSMQQLLLSWLFLLVLNSGGVKSDDEQEAGDFDCVVRGAVYGDAEASSGVIPFAELIGQVCAGECHYESSRWSSIAIDYGDMAVSSEEHCAEICQETEGCDVWTYWPWEIGTMEEDFEENDHVCVICPRIEGFILNEDHEICEDDEEGDCYTCYDMYDYALDFERDSDECREIAYYAENEVPCCLKGDLEFKPGACQLFAAMNTTETEQVLAFSHREEIVTGPSLCEETQWLPFLEPTLLLETFQVQDDNDYDDTLLKEYVECDEAWCNSWADDCCANPTPDEDWPEVQTCSTGVAVPLDNECWYTCCIPSETDAPSPAPTVSLPTSSDGRKCWIDSLGFSYGKVKDGACADAGIVQVLADEETLNIGWEQGWWKDIDEEAIGPLLGMNDYPPEDCRLACLENEECGGWEFHPRDDEGGGGCILMEEVDCLPKISRSQSTAGRPLGGDSTEILVQVPTYVGVRGCLEVNGTQSNAFDTSNSWFQQCDLPRCTEPHSEGVYVEDTFVPAVADACWYKQFDPQEIYDDCAQGRWIVLNGGSNMLSFYAQLVNYFIFARENGDPFVGFDLTFEYNMIDIVIQDGSLPANADGDGIAHFLTEFFCKLDSSIPCSDGGSLGFQGVWNSDYQNAIESMFSKAPAYNDGYTRLTLVVGQFWQNSEILLKALENAGNGWEKSQVIFLGQAMVWYPCNMEGWCEQNELGRTRTEVLQRFEGDLTQMLKTGTNTCGTDRFNCFFAPNGYESIGALARQMIGIMEQSLQPYSWAYFVNINQFLPSPAEVVEGHVTPFIFGTILSMIWNTVCDAPSTGCPEATRADPACFSNCQGRGGGDACRCSADWVCQNEQQCSIGKAEVLPLEMLTFVNPNSAGDAQNGHSDACMQLETTSIKSSVAEAVDYQQVYKSNDCKRVFCGTKMGAWMSSVILLFLGACAVLLPMLYSKKSDKEQDNTNGRKIAANMPEEAPSDPAKHVEAPTEEVTRDADDEQPSTPPQALVVAGDQVVNQTTVRGAPKEHLNSLGVARFLASTHIVLGHLLAKGAIKGIYFFRWGFTWVPWFFVLSGYVLTHARLNSSNPMAVETPFRHVAKRLASIFPMYVFGVLLAMVIRMVRDLKLPGYGVLVAQSYLLQSWSPFWVEKALVQQCWFLSNLLLYWFGFGWIYSNIRTLSLPTTLLSLVGVCFLPWLMIIVPTASDDISSTWYKEHQFGDTHEAVDIWTLMLKFHPIFYVHVFIFGMLLAVVRHHLKTQSMANSTNPLVAALLVLNQCGATLGYLGLILVFSIESIQPAGYKLSTRLSVLLPLQGLVLFGLSPLPAIGGGSGTRQDPLAILFSLAPQWLGDVSYCQYVLQFAMYDLFPVSKIDDPSFFLFLLGGSLVGYKTVQEPGANAWRQAMKATKTTADVFKILLLPSSVLAVILVIVKATYTPHLDPNTRGYIGISNYTLADPYVRLATDAVDLRLNWTLSNITSTLEEASSQYMINPSFLFHEDGNGDLKVVRAVRLHSVSQERQQIYWEGETTEITTKFNSSIWLRSERFQGNLSYGFDNMSEWGLDGIEHMENANGNIMVHLGEDEAWEYLCEPKPSYNAINKTLSRKQVNGPEDPKLVELPRVLGETPSWGLSFSSYPPAALVEGHSSPEAQDDCAGNEESVVQMFLATKGASLSEGDPTPGVQLACGKKEEDEKNWIAFTHNNLLYYVYSIEPHTVVHARVADGACVEAYKTTSGDLQTLSRNVDAIRGSATAIRYNDTEYLAILHTYTAGLGYSSRAYTFESEPPFGVLRVSKPLELQGGGRAFVSSLAIQSDKILVGYGEADVASRVLVMSQAYLETLFDDCRA